MVADLQRLPRRGGRGPHRRSVTLPRAGGAGCSCPSRSSDKHIHRVTLSVAGVVRFTDIRRFTAS
eukprot:791341-Rhodomonas_salina.4